MRNEDDKNFVLADLEDDTIVTDTHASQTLEGKPERLTEEFRSNGQLFFDGALYSSADGCGQ